MGNLTSSPELSAEETTTNKITEIIRDFDDEIHQYEKAIKESDEYAIFLKGNIAGLRRAKTTLEIFFKKHLESEVKNG